MTTTASEVHETAPIPGQLPLPLVWHLPSGLPAVPRLRLVAADEEPGPEVLGPPPPTRAWVAQIARAICEVADGERPATQLVRWVSRDELRRLAARAAAYTRHPSNTRRRPPMSRVGSVRLCLVSASAAEACAVLLGPQRARAVALRFEAARDRWVVTAISLG